MLTVFKTKGSKSVVGVSLGLLGGEGTVLLLAEVEFSRPLTMSCQIIIVKDEISITCDRFDVSS